MSSEDGPPIIIKKVKKGGGDGHHGGAWKVAYADFVTAMMAFFMLMWLLNATTEKQRKGLADFFSPTAPINRVSGGGDGAFGGDSVFTEQTLSQNGTGASLSFPSERSTAEGNGMGMSGAEDQGPTEDDDALREVEKALLGMSGEVMVTENEQRHIITKLSDEGLIVELIDLPGEPLFWPSTNQPTPIMESLIATVARTFQLALNDIAVTGHTRSLPLVIAENPVWDMTTLRASLVRQSLEENGLDPERFQRVVGKADRDHAETNPMDVSNNRIVLTLIRSDFP
ncbi:MAG: flagellar motor protein MotB [Pseudomonadota bacterium]